MKKLILIAMILAMAVTANAAEKFLKWDAVPDAVGYKVYYTNGITEWSDAVTETQLSLTVMNIPFNTEYTYRVTAYNEFGESLQSLPLTYTTEAFQITENPKPPLAYDPAPENLIVE